MKKLICIISVAFILLPSCKIFLPLHKELVQLKKGLNSQEVENIVDSDQFARKFSINNNYLQEIKITNTTNKITVILGGLVQPNMKIKYLYAFVNDKLIYWGTPLEFARNPSPLINQIGKESVKLFNSCDKD